MLEMQPVPTIADGIMFAESYEDSHANMMGLSREEFDLANNRFVFNLGPEAIKRQGSKIVYTESGLVKVLGEEISRSRKDDHAGSTSALEDFIVGARQVFMGRLSGLVV